MQQIIASYTVKPSSPTPVRFKKHKLSSLDQTAPPLYIPLIFFYERDESKHHEEISQCLKQSLSEILTIFYPLAGTIKQNSFIDCNDRGAEFVEAQVDARLAQLIRNPKMEELKQLVPVDSISCNDNVILSVKTSYFDCGGTAVGVCLSHKISDAASFVTFMNAWAATCHRESSKIIQPSFDLALRFPPKDSLSSRFHLQKEKIVTKRLVFYRENLQKLGKQTATTRVEAVSAFIWRNFIEAKSRTGETTSFPASHMVNLRSRTVPHMPDQTFGNCIMFASAVVSSEEEHDGDVDYVSKLKGAIRAVVVDFINEFISDDNYFRGLVEQSGDLFASANCTFTSWWRFPVYDVDFGWGFNY
ncbi:hypothetical protein C2S52_001585 [Perilla frutescens var. hirtella]|nr:hypothetical protein C2S52_001585 [Perilla frutescens var. hirtella]